MSRRMGAYVGVLLATASTGALASLDERPYVSLSGGYVFDDSSRGTDNGETFRATIGQRLGKAWGLEVGGFASNYKADETDWRDYGAQLDFLYFFDQAGSRFQPFIVGGVGLMLSKERTLDEESSDPFGNVGLGATYWMNLGAADVGLRGDYRFRMVDVENVPNVDAFGEHIVSLGLVVPFGAKAVAAPPPPPPPPPPPAAPKDSDGDGVIDPNDQCPDTPKGVKVDAKGCPLDSDGDGVPDYLDKCPDTPKGLKVDKDGCVRDAQTIVLQNVNFDFNKDTLTAEARAVLDAVAKGVRSQKDLKVEIAGHTDSKGSDSYNLTLSSRRAASVKSYLISQGVGADQLTSRGYGETEPVASNDTDAGRAQNRRVEFRVLNKTSVPVKVKK